MALETCPYCKRPAMTRRNEHGGLRDRIPHKAACGAPCLGGAAQHIPPAAWEAGDYQVFDHSWGRRPTWPVCTVEGCSCATSPAR